MNEDELAGPGLQSEHCDSQLCAVQQIVLSNSGVARTSPMLGHSMGTLRLYEILREVQKYLGGGRSRAWSPQKLFWNFTASQVSSEAISYCSVRRLCSKIATVR